ncbi:MAG TPA: glycosyltransferase [Chthoniobacterales bacterium]
MNFVFFVHSLVSDWNNGNAHFHRGIISELLSRGHGVRVYEPADSWSVSNLLATEGNSHVEGFRQAYPGLGSTAFATLDVPAMCRDADAIVVHEWNPPELLQAVGAFGQDWPQTVLLFHDTHHRAVSDPIYFDQLALDRFDGVLAYGRSLARVYEGKARNVWVWHEAADVKRFKPLVYEGPRKDLVWIGNWGDDERVAELQEFLIEPVRRLQLSAAVYGVRYPVAAGVTLRNAHIEYGGWLPNYQVPDTFARFKATMHIPRGPYVHRLPGIPTIRPFEALACGIPLVSAPWQDDEAMFTAGKDYLRAENGDEMAMHLQALMESQDLASALREHGLKTIHERHTCAHRVNELLAIVEQAYASK